MTLAVEGFRIGRLLYEDALLERYEATPESGGAPVRLTVIPCAEEDAAEAFQRDAEAARALGDRGPATVLEVGRTDGRGYVVQPLAPVRTLADLLAEGPLPPERAAAIGVDVASELAAAHALSPPLAHLALRPGSVIVGDDDRARLDDFAVARAGARAASTYTGGLEATCRYLAPEQVSPRGVPDGRADLFALASILYEAITGKAAFEDSSPVKTTVKVAMAKPPPLDGVPPAFAETLRGLWAREPEKRGDAAACAHALASIAGREPPAMPAGREQRATLQSGMPVFEMPAAPPPRQPPPVAPPPAASFDPWAGGVDATDVSIRLPNHVPDDVSLGAPRGDDDAFGELDAEPTAIAPSPLHPASEPALVAPPSPAQRYDVSVPDTKEIAAPGPYDAPEWGDSTAPLVSPDRDAPAPIPNEPAPQRVPVSMPPLGAVAPAPRPSVDPSPPRRHIGPVDMPEPAPPSRGVPPALIWAGVGAAAIFMVVLTAVIAIWLVS